MSQDYLWDKIGRDEEVESLERLLRPLAYNEPAPARRYPRFLLVAAVAAAVALVFLTSHVEDVGPRYRVHTTARQFDASRGARIEANEEIRIDLAGIGLVVAEPQARLQVLAIGEDLHKLRLERGTVHASIGAFVKPRLFQIETPATTCVDLGCHYTLTVDDAGRSLVRVSTGRVAFVDGEREVYIPAGAACRAAPPSGSGTPCFEDAPAALLEAVRSFDEAEDPHRVAAARALAALATRPRDTLVLWHLLQDRDFRVLEAGLDALVKTKPLPEGVTRDDVLRRAPGVLEAWRDSLRSDWR